MSIFVIFIEICNVLILLKALVIARNNESFVNFCLDIAVVDRSISSIVDLSIFWSVLIEFQVAVSEGAAGSTRTGTPKSKIATHAHLVFRLHGAMGSVLGFSIPVLLNKLDKRCYYDLDRLQCSSDLGPSGWIGFCLWKKQNSYLIQLQFIFNPFVINPKMIHGKGFKID